MKIHIVHSKDFDFKKELYSPLRNSELNKQHQIFLPHETGEFIKTKTFIKDADVIVAEVSFSATGLGIELGWADAFNRPILCLYKTGTKVSGSLKAIYETFIEYFDSEDLIVNLTQALEKHPKRKVHGQ